MRRTPACRASSANRSLTGRALGTCFREPVGENGGDGNAARTTLPNDVANVIGTAHHEGMGQAIGGLHEARPGGGGLQAVDLIAPGIDRGDQTRIAVPTQIAQRAGGGLW